MGGTCSMHGDKNVHRILWGNVREDRWMCTHTDGADKREGGQVDVHTHRWGRHYRQYLRTVSCCDYTAPAIDDNI